MHLTEEKTKLRQDIKERIERMSEEKRHAEGRTLSRILLKTIPPNSTVCAFFPLKTEIDVRPLLTELLRRGDTLYLPVFDKKGLLFRKVTDITTLLPGELGIPEPPIDAPKLEDETVHYILVPGRAFDRTGNRLGRGSGGYDRWLKRYRTAHPSTKFFGVCLECQMVPKVPVEAHDVVMDVVFTSRGNVNEEES